MNKKRCGFTLIELLVAIAIIGILAAVTMGVLQAARQTARVAKTKATIAKLNSIVMYCYESYHTRRVPLSRAQIDQIIAENGWSPPLQAVARVRLNALYDLMRMEMPDRWSDVNGPPLVSGLPRPALSRRLQGTYDRSTASADARESWAAAECLYLIVMSTPDAADKFNENEIGDVDEDGLREFLDGWGRPIRFIRWPAGFIPDNDADTDLQSGDADQDHDLFDTRRVEGGYAIYPLIYSAGPDGIFDINIGMRDASAGGSAVYAYSNPDPYTVDDNTPAHMIGRPLDGQSPTGELENGEPDHFDNIHNHRIEAR